MRLSVQTLFLPRESLFYMEEWLLYHTLLGFDKFRLYDNTGSAGDAYSVFRTKYDSSLSKYGLPLISRDSKDSQIQEAARKICERFDAEIIPWPSELYTNEVQIRAVMDHCGKDDSDYTAFIDMDEYICVPSGGIKRFIKDEVEAKGYCGVRMSQQKMPHILKEKATTKRRVWELTETFEMETKNWAPKNILPTASVRPHRTIHDIYCLGKMMDQPSRNLIKINHYNVNEYQMHWLKQNHMKFDKKTPFEKLFLGQSRDLSLERFKEEMEKWDYFNLEEAL